MVCSVLYWKRRAFSKDELKIWKRTVAYYANLAKTEQGWKMVGDCPVSLELEFGFIRPKSNKSKHMIHHYKPDITNLEKALEDALNFIVWKDDCQVGIKATKKIWSDRNYVRIKVIDLEE